MFFNFFLIFLPMKNLGAMADSRYTGFREITDRDVLRLHCIGKISPTPWRPCFLNNHDGLINLGRGSARAHFCQVI